MLGQVTVAQRFAAALDAAGGAGEPPELLPVRLAQATVATLPVDGAGLSVLSGRHGRCPLGGSDPEAELAERLQFTADGGPCQAAFDSGRPVFAMPEDLTTRWPAFAAPFTARTRYRGVVALPFRRGLAGIGALDLYLVDPAGVPRLDVFDAVAVADLVTTALSEAAVWSVWTESTGPDWLRSPAAVRRAGVWQALGQVALELEIDLPTALARLRAQAGATGGTVDDVAAALLRGDLPTADLTAVP